MPLRTAMALASTSALAANSEKSQSNQRDCGAACVV